MDYEINEHVLQSKKKAAVAFIAPWLKRAYEIIVRPMTRQIKELMLDKKLLNEAEIFCSNLQFRPDQSGHARQYIGDVAKNSDDLIKHIHETV